MIDSNNSIEDVIAASTKLIKSWLEQTHTVIVNASNGKLYLGGTVTIIEAGHRRSLLTMVNGQAHTFGAANDLTMSHLTLKQALLMIPAGPTGAVCTKCGSPDMHQHGACLVCYNCGDSSSCG